MTVSAGMWFRRYWWFAVGVIVLLCLAGVPGATQQITRAMHSALEEPFWLSGREVAISASIGVSLFPDHGSTATQLLHNADCAMYIAKRNGRGLIQHHSEQSDGQAIVTADAGYCFGLLTQPDR